MRNPHKHRWPVSLYWTIMLGVPTGGLVAMGCFYLAVLVVRAMCQETH